MKKMDKKNLKKYAIRLGLIIIGIFLLNITYTFSKYVYNKAWDYYLSSKGFYFSSDSLDSDEKDNVLNSWNGGSVFFNIQNKQSESQITDYNIDYEIECTILGEQFSIAECHLDGGSSNITNGTLTAYQACSNDTGDSVDVSGFNKTTCELGGYDWLDQVATGAHYFNVALTDPEYNLSDVTVRISAKSTSPYIKTISGTFTLHKVLTEQEEVSMEYKNYDNYVRLIITNTSSSDECVNISWNPNNLLFDPGAQDFTYGSDSNDYINEINVNIAGHSSYSYMFFKKVFGNIYSISEFSLTEGDNCN